MTDEKENKTEGSPMDKAREMVESLNKATQEAKQEADRLQTLKQDALLSGTAGIRQEPKTVEETPGQYAARILRGGK